MQMIAKTRQYRFPYYQEELASIRQNSMAKVNSIANGKFIIQSISPMYYLIFDVFHIYYPQILYENYRKSIFLVIETMSEILAYLIIEKKQITFNFVNLFF